MSPQAFMYVLGVAAVCAVLGLVLALGAHLKAKELESKQRAEPREK